MFDNEVLAEAVWLGYRIGEVSCPTRYAPDASSIGLRGSVVYGLGCLATGCAFRLSRLGLLRSRRFPRETWMRCRPAADDLRELAPHAGGGAAGFL